MSKSSHALASSNIKKELAKAFPGIKFSVRSKSYAGGDSVDVSWTLGPTSNEIDAIINKYQYGDFDGMTDSYNYRSHGDDFRESRGSAKYVHASRSMPEGLFEQMCREIAGLQGVGFTSTRQRRENETLDLSDYARHAFARTSFPAGAEYVRMDYGLELQLTSSCGAEDAYRIIHSQTNEEEEMRKVIRSEFDYIQSREPERKLRLVAGGDH